ncbi:uncharacterized protein LOC105702243 [Orussus abietinus]|uniref:uncharacterized protein LOC105702243 n=1 Tax=Orussus abietinus TaxID=222816 RepID=UPI000626ACF7|nr:uncharacterized protein LOC105702243 [Orussus abietinus]
MARASTLAQCDAVASSMDGVNVKIAEAYKPPRRIALPAAYNNRLPDVSRYEYDFTLEKSVVTKIVEWRKVRNEIIQARRTRLEEKKKVEEEEERNISPPPSESISQPPVKATPVPETTVLTPQPLSPPANDLQNCIKSNGLNLADFDNDTSSPFDNMELKSINDMEELAQVLQPNSQWVPSVKLENIMEDATLSHDRPKDTESETHFSNRAVDRDESNNHCNSNHRSVAVIVEELQKELTRPFMENWKPWPDLESPVSNTERLFKPDNPSSSISSRSLSPLLAEMSENDRKLVKHLSDMGFPLSRAARAVHELGGEDNKKVVEYLLAVQSLEELGISGDKVEKALALTQYNQDKAKLYHENLCTLMDLGFPEDEASAALLKCDIDRDKALDYLVG